MGACQSFREMCDRTKNTNVRLSLPAVCVVWQTAMIILFGVFIRYNEEADAHWVEHRKAKNISDIENDFYFRYPNDITVIGLISGGDETAYRDEVNKMAGRCSKFSLLLNTSKTKEMVIDFRKHKGDAALSINGIVFSRCRPSNF